jgi:hypothetical protein
MLLEIELLDTDYNFLVQNVCRFFHSAEVEGEDSAVFFFKGKLRSLQKSKNVLENFIYFWETNYFTFYSEVYTSNYIFFA